MGGIDAGGTVQLVAARGSSMRRVPNVWFPTDSPPTTKRCLNLGTTLIEWPERGIVSRGRVVMTRGLSMDHD